MNTFYKVVIVVWAMLCTTTMLHAQIYPPGFQAIRIAQGLNPTDMKFSPGGQYLFIADKRGYVFLVENDALLPDTVLNISIELDVAGERGLTHVAVDPDFAVNHYIYLYYTKAAVATNRIGRFVFDMATKKLTFDNIYLDLEPMVAAIHTGGALNFGKDGKLYVTTGESSHPPYAQAINSLLGKVLRMNKDLSIPTDNPFYGIYSGRYQYIYAMGFRNPFGADVDPKTGRYFINDVGQNIWEEINEVQAGRNYGWSVIEGLLQPGTTPPANYKDPLFTYSHTNDGCAIVGAAFYNPPAIAFPARWEGKYFYGDYCNHYIRTINPTTGQFDTTFASGIGNPVAFAVKPSGEFYYLDRGGDPYGNESILDGVLWKVVYTGSLAPVIGAQPASVMVSVGSSALFSVQATGPNLTYKWLKNGVIIPGSVAASISFSNVQLADSGAIITAVVSNQHGADTSDAAILRVTTRTGPSVDIVTPAIGDTYIAGQNIAYSGSATDAVDGIIPASRLTWQIDFHHEAHHHPAMDATTGSSAGIFHVPSAGEVSDTVWLRIYLTAENSAGIKTQVYKDIFPQKVNLVLTTTSPGIPFNLDGSLQPTPASVLSVKGVVRTITAPATYMNADTLFTFTSWGNGSTNPQLTFATPLTDTAFHANYARTAVFDGTGLTAEYRTATSAFTTPPTVTRVDPVINYEWNGSPIPGFISSDNYTVRWKGAVMPRTSGLYTFYLTSKHYGGLYINDVLFIDRLNFQVAEETGKDTVLQAGVKYNIRVDLMSGYGPPFKAGLRWSGPEVVRQLIATSSLFQQQAVLPVVFEDFQVRPQENALQLWWKATDWGHEKSYAVERRKTGSDAYETIASIVPAGSGVYTYADAAVVSNTLYEYRIRQEDEDGQKMYSIVRIGTLSSRTGFDITILPNPVKASRQVKLLMTQPLQKAQVLLVAPDGRSIPIKQLAVTGQTIDMSLSGIAAGTYYIKVIEGDQQVVKKLIIQ